MRRRFVLFGALLVIRGALCAEAPVPHGALSVLSKVKDGILNTLGKADIEMAFATGAIAARGLKDPEVIQILQKLKGSLPNAEDCAVLDPQGVVVMVEPSTLEGVVGRDMSGETQVEKILETKKPVLSRLYRTPEGFNAVDIEHPILTYDRKFLGSVSVRLEPAKALAAIVEPAVRGTNVEVWVMQADGRILYDVDAGEIGKMLFSDTAFERYPQLISLGELIAKEKKGEGTYVFPLKGMGKEVEKQAHWDTVELYGTSWRITATAPVEKGQPMTIAALMRAEYDAFIKAEVQTAVSMLQAVYGKYEGGEMSLEEAKKLGADLLRDLRYGDGKEGYFWADTTEGVNVVLYGRKDVEGKNRMAAEINGIYYIREIISNGMKPGGGYSDYYFPRKGEENPLPKRSYSLLFGPFGWVVGTGYYVDDANRVILSKTRRPPE